MAPALPMPLPPLREIAHLTSPVTSAVLAGIHTDAPGLIAGLEAEGVHTWSADHAAEAMEVARQVKPDLVLLGEELDADPSFVLAELREAAPGARILFLLGSVGIRRAAFLLSLGVDDVLAPPHAASHVLLRAAVGPILEARQVIRPGTAERIVVDRFSRMVLSNQEGAATLTVREFELLERLLEAHGRVVSREALLADIWGEEQDNEAVLDATVHRLRRKLEADHASPRLLVTIRGVGYRLEDSRVSIDDG